MIYSKEILQYVLDRIVSTLETNPNSFMSFDEIIWPTEYDIFMEIDNFVKIVYLKKLIRDGFIDSIDNGLCYQITPEGVMCSRQDAYITGHSDDEYYYDDVLEDETLDYLN